MSYLYHVSKRTPSQKDQTGLNPRCVLWLTSIDWPRLTDLDWLTSIDHAARRINPAIDLGGRGSFTLLPPSPHTHNSTSAQKKYARGRRHSWKEERKREARTKLEQRGRQKAWASPQKRWYWYSRKSGGDEYRTYLHEKSVEYFPEVSWWWSTYYLTCYRTIGIYNLTKKESRTDVTNIVS